MNFERERRKPPNARRNYWLWSIRPDGMKVIVGGIECVGIKHYVAWRLIDYTREPLPNKFKTLDDTKCKLIAVLRILK